MLRALTKLSVMKLSISAISHSRSVAGFCLLFLIGLLCVSVWPVLVSLIDLWLTISDYDYCIFIALISLGWIFFLGRKIDLVKIRPNYFSLIAVLLLCLIEFVLWQGMSSLGSQILIPLIIFFSIISVIGLSQAVVFVLPVFFLYFSIPIWDQFLPLLQQLAILGSVAGMKVLGVKVTLLGNKIIIPEGTFVVLYACSGLRYLVVSLALSVLIASINNFTRRGFWVLLSVSVIMAIVFNWLRIVIVIYAGHLTSMQHYFVSENHKWLGQVIFMFLLIVIFVVSEKLNDTNFYIQEKNSEDKSYGGQNLPIVGKLQAILAMFLCSLVFIVLGFFILRSEHILKEARISPKLGVLPFSSGRWQGPLPSKSDWHPRFIGVADSRQVSYGDPDSTVHVYQNIYGLQSKGSELIFYGNNVYSPGDWQLVGYDFLSIVKSVFGLCPYSTVQLSPDGQKWLIGELYTVGSHKTSVGLFAQMLYGWSTLTGGAPSGILVISIKCASDCDLERNSLADFWSNMGQALIASVPTVLEPGSVHLKEFK